MKDKYWRLAFFLMLIIHVLLLENCEMISLFISHIVLISNRLSWKMGNNENVKGEIYVCEATEGAPITGTVEHPTICIPTHTGCSEVRCNYSRGHNFMRIKWELGSIIFKQGSAIVLNLNCRSSQLRLENRIIVSLSTKRIGLSSKSIYGLFYRLW